MRKKVSALAVGLLAALAVIPAEAGPTLPFRKTVTVEMPATGLYSVGVSTGAWLNRCFATGGGDCIPHNEDVQITRGGLARLHRCVYLADPGTAQSEVGPGHTQNPGSGKWGFLFDFGLDATVSGKYFSVKALTTSTTGTTDFDITWYKTLGNCTSTADGDPKSPTQNTSDSQFSNPGNEEGRVPGYIEQGAPQSICDTNSNGTIKPGCPRYAIVSLFGGDPGSRFQFTICSTNLRTSCPSGSF